MVVMGNLLKKISVLLKVVFQFRSLFVNFCGSLCLVVCHFRNCLMTDRKDCRRGWFPLVRHVPSFRTKYAIPEKFD